MSDLPFAAIESTCTTGATLLTAECTLERLKEIMAKVAALKPKYNRVKMSRQTFDAFCVLYNIETRHDAPESFPLRFAYGLEVIFDEEMPLGKYKLE